MLAKNPRKEKYTNIRSISGQKEARSVDEANVVEIPQEQYENNNNNIIPIRKTIN